MQQQQNNLTPTLSFNASTNNIPDEEQRLDEDNLSQTTMTEVAKQLKIIKRQQAKIMLKMEQILEMHNKNDTESINCFPIETEEDLLELENKLLNKEFSLKMVGVIFFKKKKVNGIIMF